MNRRYQIGLFCFSFLIASLCSSCSNRERLDAAFLESGLFRLKSNGIGNDDIEGLVYFTKNEVEDEGIQIVFDFEVDHISNSINFIVPDSQKIKNKFKGDYKISHLNSLLTSSVDEVYAFADIKSVDEVPFFAKHGQISILSESGQELHGELSVDFTNANNKTFSITGVFNAKQNFKK